jgi:hypothetical protein
VAGLRINKTGVRWTPKKGNEMDIYYYEENLDKAVNFDDMEIGKPYVLHETARFLAGRRNWEANRKLPDGQGFFVRTGGDSLVGYEAGDLCPRDVALTTAYRQNVQFRKVHGKFTATFGELDGGLLPSIADDEFAPSEEPPLERDPEETQASSDASLPKAEAEEHSEGAEEKTSESENEERLTLREVAQRMDRWKWSDGSSYHWAWKRLNKSPRAEKMGKNMTVKVKDLEEVFGPIATKAILHED